MADLLKRLQISEKQYGVGMENNPFQNASPDECMNVCFGGSGGGGSPPPAPPQSVTQQTSNIPEYFQPYLERLFERAEGVTTEPFQRYEGQRLAEFTPEQQAAYSGVGELVGDYKPYIASADLLTTQAAQQSTDPTAIAARMNPYQQAVIDIQKREALRDAEKLQQQIGAQAVGAGAFGGSRQALVESELARQQGQRLADIQAVGSQQAYDTAMEQLAGDRAASLAAGQQFATLGGQQQQLGLAGLGALETVGGTRQSQQQQALDVAYEDFARETTRPSQQVQEMSSVLRGFNLPVSTYTTAQQQTQQPGLGQQLLGAGLGVYGLGSQFGLFKEGGIVNKANGGILSGSTRYDPSVNPDDFSRPYVSSIYKFVSDPRNPRNPFSGQRTFTNPYDKKDRTRYDVKKGEIPSFIEGRDRMLFEKGLKEVGYAEDQEPGGVPDVAGANVMEKDRLDRDYLLSTRQILADRPEVVENLGEFDTTLSEPSDILTAGDRGPMPYMETNRRVVDGEVIGPGEQPKSVAEQTQPGGSPVGDLSGLAPFLNTDIKDILTAKPGQQAAPEDVGPKGSTNIENKLNAIIEGYDKSKTEGDEREKKGVARLPGDLIASIGLNLMTGDPEAGPGFLTQAGSAVKKVLPEATRRREREEDREEKTADRREDVALKALGIQTDLEKVKLQEAGKDTRLDKELGYKYDVFGAEIGLKKKDLDSQIKVREANIVEMGRKGNLSEMEVINRLVNDKETLALTKEKFEFNKGLKNQELSLAERKQLFNEDQAIVDTNLRRAELLAKQGATSAAEKKNIIDVLDITQDAISEMQKELSNPLLQGSKDIIIQQINKYQSEVNNLKQMLGVGVSTAGGQPGAGGSFGYGSVIQLGP